MQKVVFDTLIEALDEIVKTYGDGKETVTPRAVLDSIREAIEAGDADTDEARDAFTMLGMMACVESEQYVVEAKAANRIADLLDTDPVVSYDPEIAHQVIATTATAIIFARKISRALDAEDAVVLTEEKVG